MSGNAPSSPAPEPSRHGGRVRRVRALIVKESRQIMRDPSSIALGIVMPVMLILLFGYALSLDVRNAPIALVIEQFDGSARRRAPYRKPRAIASPAMRPVVHAD